MGTGKPSREFIHTDDLSNAIYTCLKVSNKKLKKQFGLNLPIMNIGTGFEISINKLAKIIAGILKYKGQIIFDKNSPDGTLRKNLNSQKILDLGWYPNVEFTEGLAEVIQSRLNDTPN